MTEQKMQALVKKIKASKVKLLKLIRQIDTALNGYSEECNQVSTKAIKKINLSNASGKVKKKKTSG